MAYNGAGIFQLVAGNPVVTGTIISSTWANNTLADIANNGLSNCITKDGQTTPTANIPLNGNHLTGLGDGTNPQDSVNLRQLQASQAALIAIQNFTASVAANALTGTFTPSGSLQFRNPTLSNGTPVSIQSSGALSLTVPSGATLGTISAQSARIVWLVAYNGGTPALCVANLAGGVNLDETTLISTTAISAGATAANVIYSTGAISNSPFRVVGFCDISEATAGTWSTAPTTVQGIGGQALAALGSLGYGQTWQDLTGSRLLATTYYNTTGKPIQVKVSAQSSSTNYFAQLAVNGVNIVGSTSPVANVIVTVDAIVPPGASYIATIPVGGASLSKWFELR